MSYYTFRKIIRIAKNNSLDKTIRKHNIIYALQLNQGGGSVNAANIADVEANFCGYNPSQCYNQPKPCIGCGIVGIGSSGGGNRINKIKNKIKKLVKSKYPEYKITHHAVNLLAATLSTSSSSSLASS